MGSSSKFVGVAWDKRDQNWRASIKIDGKDKRIGNFRDEETAARKYDEHAAPLGRPLNFPSDGQAQAVKMGAGEPKQLAVVKVMTSQLFPLVFYVHAHPVLGIGVAAALLWRWPQTCWSN